jgi:phage terminase large subunit
MIACANPGPETHWVYDRIVNEKTKRPDSRYIHVTLFDNEKNLPDDYVKFVRSKELTSPEWYERFVLGLWGAFGGKRFKTWNPKIHVVDTFADASMRVPSDYEVIESIDYGFANPFCCLWIAIDHEGVWWVTNEHYEAERPISYHAKIIKKTRELHNLSPSATYIDPSTFARRGEYESVAIELIESGIPVGKAQNDRLGGWARIDELLTSRDTMDGGPRLRIFSRCENLIRELPSLKIKEGTDDVEKEYDHAADALRYAIMTRPVTPSRQEAEKTMREQAIARIYERAISRERQALLLG